MKKRYQLFILLSVLLVSVNVPNCSAAQKKGTPLYKNPKASVEQRVNDLLGRMTLEEKIMQVNQYFVGPNDNTNNAGEAAQKIPAELGSLIYIPTEPALRNSIQRRAMEDSRLGIPMIFGYDVIHGYRTIFPIPLAQACSWNPELVEKGCHFAAKEAKLSGIDWTFSPMIDVSRDPRWGRIAECYGEDPYTNGVFGAAAVRGYQGKSLTDTSSIAACLKHYVGYGASEAGRDYVFTEISLPSLWNTYLPPYGACVKAGAATLMSSFNDISGTPGSANHYTLTEVLRNKWGFDGFVVSDWGAVSQLINQGMAKDMKEACRLSLTAGVDMDMMSHSYDRYMKANIDEKRIDMAVLNEAVKRILRVKFRLGLFEKPYVSDNNSAERFLRPDSRAAAEELAGESMVLLKNNGALPLSGVKKIAVIGPLAKDGNNLLGCWHGHGEGKDVNQLFDGIAGEFKDAEVNYAYGCNFNGNDTSRIAEAVNLASESDVTVLCLGEEETWSGENASRADISLPEIQQQLICRIHKTDTKMILVLATGRPVIINKIVDLPDAIIEIWHPGVNGARPLAGILSGRVNPSGRLSVTFPLTQGQIPIYYDRHSPARTGSQGRYGDLSSEPLYPFGHGLSYTTFSYSPVTASATDVKRGGTVQLEVNVTNTGKTDGKETVFWYICDPYSTITRPCKELKHFEKRMIKAGTTEKFSFNADVNRDFGYLDADGKLLLEAGEVYISVGNQKTKLKLNIVE